MKQLSEAQRSALAGYADLIVREPALFTPRALRRLVLDPDALAAWAAEHGIVLGLAAVTSHLYLLIDLVDSDTDRGEVMRYTYQRIISRRQLSGGFNVVLLATIADPALGRPGDLVVIEQERHATGQREFELPRGFGQPGLSIAENGVKELREETGYLGGTVREIGMTITDSGLMDAVVHYLHIEIVGIGPRTTNPREAICGIHRMSVAEIWSAIRNCTIRDGFTVQAMAFWQKAGSNHDDGRDFGAHRE